VVRTLRQVFSGVSFADRFCWLLRLVLGFLRLVLGFLRDHWLELEECYPLRHTYCMSA
jgi:hypothetical protein